jgi:hypothetical protein
MQGLTEQEPKNVQSTSLIAKQQDRNEPTIIVTPTQVP